MLNIAGRRIPFLLGMWPFNLIDLRQKIDHSARSYYIENDPDETGWDRLYNMYSIDEFGNLSPEIHSVLQGVFGATLTGVVWGGVTNGKVAYLNFVQRNDATKFETHLDAKRKLQDNVTVNFAKGGFRWGWRLGLFTGSYILVSTTIATYRGKSSIIEYITAGLVTGGCYKFSMGPRGMLVGASLGGILGGLGGIISLGLLKLSGTTMEEIRYWQYNWKKNRDRLKQGGLKKAVADDSQLEKLHDSRVKSESTELIPDIEEKPRT